MEVRGSASERFFLSLYDAATLRGAVERAATQERESDQLLDVQIRPVDVDRIARSKGIQLRHNVNGPGCREAALLPVRDGFLVQLRPDAVPARKRFSLAHEIGHTLFYKNRGEGPRHQVGLLSLHELVAEERICNMFARALLLPASEVRSACSNEVASPWDLIRLLEVLSRNHRVSIPLLLIRLRDLQIQRLPFLILYSRFEENQRTRGDARLRVQTSFMIGDSEGMRVWRNRSLDHLNLRSACWLFDSWRTEIVGTRAADSVYSIKGGCLVAGSAAEGGDGIKERVKISVNSSGKWRNWEVPCRVVNSLYSWSARSERDAYIISVLQPEQAGSADPAAARDLSVARYVACYP